MALEILGDGFDLHGGGDDLVFPHHENERAQAEAAGHAFSRHWVHSGMVEVGGEKMSKSLGNFTSLADAIDAHGPRAFRLAVLQVHYRSRTELGPSEMQAAGEAVERLDALVRRAEAAGIDVRSSARDAPAVAAFQAAMDNDFGTPAAVAAIFDAVKRANVAIDAGDLETAGMLVATVRDLGAALGLEIGISDAAADSAEIDALVAARDAARAARDFGEADRIRNELAARGVTLEDTAAGTIWHR
jgi:cysteinyl-tRNA synthetase